MKKTKKMKHIRRRLMAGLFCISMVFADLGTVLPAWAQETAMVAEQTQSSGENETSETQNPGEDSDIKGEENAEKPKANDGTDGDGGESGNRQEQDSDAGNDVDYGQDAGDGNLSDGSQDSDEGNNTGETQEPEEGDDDSESPKETEEDGAADDAEDDTEDSADTEKAPDLSKEVEDPEAEGVPSVSGNELEDQGGVHVLEASADAITSGTYKDITWMIDANGKLTVEGSGEFADLSVGGNNNTDYKRVPWRDHASEIKTAQIHVSGMTDASYMFYMCTNLTSVDLSGFEAGTVTNMESMFNCCSSLESLDLSSIDTSKVTNMASMFGTCNKLSKLNLSGVDTGNVTTMQGMFNSCRSLTNIDVSSFNTANVENMASMFASCSSLKGLDLSNFNTDKVTRMDQMFAECQRMTELNVTGFHTANVVTMEGMFSNCAQLTELDLHNFDTGFVETMRYMFRSCGKLTCLDLHNFDTACVTNMEAMFAMCYDLNDLNVSGFNTSNVTQMYGMFSSCMNLTSLDLSSFDTRKVKDMRSMFSQCSKLESLDLHNFNTQAIGTSAQNTGGMVSMFSQCTNLAHLDISGFDISNTDSLYGMFAGCSKLSYLDLSNFDTSNITDMREMFVRCSNLADLNLSGFNTSKVTNMSAMFSGCSALTTLDLSSFSTERVTNMSTMFSGCTALKDLDLDNFDTASVTNMGNMFKDCSSLEHLDLSSFDLSKVTRADWMFSGCSSLTGLDLSSFNFSGVTNSYGMFASCSRMETIYTPYNVTVNAQITLPTESSSDVWYRSDDKTEIRILPEGLDHSILVTRNKVPEVTEHIMARKTKTAYTCGEMITLNDLTVTCYGADGTVKKLTQEQYTTNVAQIDMSEAGEKRLIVTYENRGTKLTAEIILTVTYGLAADTATIIIPAEGDYNYTYDGQPKQPIPTAVTYTRKAVDGTETSVALKAEIDYAISYCNNINAYEVAAADTSGGGTDTTAESDSTAAPTIIIKGIGDYSGTVTKIFTIRKADAPAAETMNVTASQCTQAQPNRKIDLTGSFAACGKKNGYEIVGVEDTDSIFSKTPVTADIEDGVLTYGTNVAQENATASIKIRVSFQNYKDAELTVTITMVSKKTAVISGIAMQDSVVYNGVPVSYSGKAVVKTEDGTDITGEVTLVYRYSGTMADGTAYPAQGDTVADTTTAEAPMNAGSYELTVTVKEDNPNYVGSAEYPFTIAQADAAVKAKDTTVLMQAVQAGSSALVPVEQYQASFAYEVTGLLNADTLQKEPVYTVTEDEAGAKPVTAIDTSKAGVYYIHPSGADAGMNYGLTYKPGILTVSEERVAYTVTFDGMGHCDSFIKNGIKAGVLLELTDSERMPAAKEQGYVFAGWYKDKSFAKGKEWNFDTDTVQTDLTLYACWLTAAAQDRDGLKLCVQEIPDLTYTGSAQKPAVTVYDSDGKTALKAGKDYTIKYVRNTDAVAVGEDGQPAVAGGTAKVTNPGKTTEKITDVIGHFSKDCPYVVITGKGNYKETIYRNFRILPADISAAGETSSAVTTENTPLAAGFTLKYTEQFEAKANKTAKIVSSFKYKKTLKADKDYTVSVQDENGAEVALVQGKLPLNVGNYALTITGKGNYTGVVRRNLYVADKQKLMKNASISYAKTVKAVNKEDLFKGIEQTAVVVKIGGKEIDPENYEIDYAGTNHAVGTATMNIKGKNGYVGSKSVTFKITGMPFSAKTIEVKAYDANQPNEKDWKASMPYTGRAVTQNKVTLTAKVTSNNPNVRNLVYGDDYTIAYKNNVKKGTATMIFTANPKSGFSGSFKKTFKVSAQKLSADMFADSNSVKKELVIVGTDERKNNTVVKWDEDAVHSGGGASLSFILKNKEGIALKQGTDYTVSYKNHKTATKESAEAAVKAGSKQPVMTIKGKGNYVGSLTVQFQIIPASISSGQLKVTAAQVQKKNGMKLKDFKVKIMDGKTTLKADKDYTVDDTGCTPEIIKAYADSLGTAEVAPEPKLVLTGIGNYGAKTAGGEAADGRREISLADYIYVTKLTAKNLKVEVTGDRTYTGQNVEPTVKVSYYKDNNAAKQDAIGVELANGIDYKVTYGSKNIPAGKKKGSITIIGAGSYGGSVTVKFDIEKKEIY